MQSPLYQGAFFLIVVFSDAVNFALSIIRDPKKKAAYKVQEG
jgi:hypothetical protein